MPGVHLKYSKVALDLRYNKENFGRPLVLKKKIFTINKLYLGDFPGGPVD